MSLPMRTERSASGIASTRRSDWPSSQPRLPSACRADAQEPRSLREPQFRWLWTAQTASSSAIKMVAVAFAMLGIAHDPAAVGVVFAAEQSQSSCSSSSSECERTVFLAGSPRRHLSDRTPAGHTAHRVAVEVPVPHRHRAPVGLAVTLRPRGPRTESPAPGCHR